MQNGKMYQQQTQQNKVDPTAEKSLRSVFVGNIPYEVTEDQLKEIFSEVGPVLTFRMVYDRETGKPKGYGFAEYKDQETALSAMRNLNGYEISGRTLRVDHAVSQKSQEEIKNLGLSGPQQETPYGPPVAAQEAPEAISKAVASLPPEQMFELMKQMKLCIRNNPSEARNMLLQNPQLAYALLQAQIVMKIVDMNVAQSILHTPNEPVKPVTLAEKQPQLQMNTLPTLPSQSVMAGNAMATSLASVAGIPATVGPMAAMMQNALMNQLPMNQGGGLMSNPLLQAGMMQQTGMNPMMGQQPMATMRTQAPMGQGLSPMNQGQLSAISQGAGMGMRSPLDAHGGVGFTNRLPQHDSVMRDRDDRMVMNQRTPYGGATIHERDRDFRESRDPRDPRLRDTRDRDFRDPRLDTRDLERDTGSRVDPRDPRMATRVGAAVTASANYGQSPSDQTGDNSEQEKANLIMQVLQLTPEQISMLPADQQQSIMVLKEQIARSQGTR